MTSTPNDRLLTAAQARALRPAKYTMHGILRYLCGHIMDQAGKGESSFHVFHVGDGIPLHRVDQPTLDAVTVWLITAGYKVRSYPGGQRDGCSLTIGWGEDTTGSAE